MVLPRIRNFLRFFNISNLHWIFELKISEGYTHTLHFNIYYFTYVFPYVPVRLQLTLFFSCFSQKKYLPLYRLMVAHPNIDKIYHR